MASAAEFIEHVSKGRSCSWPGLSVYESRLVMGARYERHELPSGLKVITYKVCGSPAVNGKPYCAAHMAVAYVPDNRSTGRLRNDINIEQVCERGRSNRSFRLPVKSPRSPRKLSI